MYNIVKGWEDTEFILRIILNKPALKVKSVHAQHELKNLNGRSVKLDVHAVEENGTEINIEIQRDDRGAGFKRARHNSSLLDASILKPGQKPEELPEIYVIFITESDIIGLDEPIYPIERYISVQGKYIPVEDGAYTITPAVKYRRILRRINFHLQGGRMSCSECYND